MLIAIVFLIIGSPKKELGYYIDSTRTPIIRLSNKPSDLKYLLKNKEIKSDLTSVQIVIFNNGKRGIDYSDILKNIKGKFILSINDDEYIKKLFPETKYRIEIVSTNYSIMNSKSKKVNELLIMNY